MNKQTALITGASSGIGAVYADRLAARGYNLILVARRAERLQKLADELAQKYGANVQVCAADLAQENGQAAVAEIIENTSDLTLLVNCAGLGALGFAANVAWADVDGLIKVNVQALTRLSLTAAKRFIAEKRGNIVNIGSIIAQMPVADASAYSASKAYVLNFTRALHAELAEVGAGAQAVMPGPVKSEFLGDKAAPFPEALFMTAETLVDTALAALDQQEWVCYPNLQDIADWQQLEAARGKFAQGVTQTGKPADRYQTK